MAEAVILAEDVGFGFHGRIAMSTKMATCSRPCLFQKSEQRKLWNGERHRARIAETSRGSAIASFGARFGSHL